MAANTDLTNARIADTYKQLLHIGDDGAITSTLTGVYDGDGTASPLKISTTAVQVIDGAYDFDIASHDGSNGLKLGGTLVTSSAAELNYLDITTLGTSQASKAVTVNSSGDLIVPDSDKFKFGAGSDMQLYHDGSNSYITNAVGALKIATETSGIAVTIGHTTSETTIADNVTVTGNAAVGGNLTVTGTSTFNGGTITLGDAASDTIAFGGTITGNLVFEGSTSDAHELTLSPGDPSGDVTVTLPVSTDTLVGKATTDTLTNKTLTAPDINTGTVDGITSLTVGTDGSGADVYFYSATSGDHLFWDASEELLTITGTNGQTALNVADGNVTVADTLTATNIGAFTLSGKLTAGSTEIEGSAFDIDGGDISAATISGGLTWSAAQDLNNQNLTNVDIDSGAIDGTTIGASSAAAGTFAALVGTSLSVSDGNITNVGDIAIDSISADATDIDIKLTDNSATALEIKESSTAYLTFVTTNSGEKIQIDKSLDINATSDFGSNAMTNVNIDSGAIDGTTIGANSAGAGTFSTMTATTSVLGTLGANVDHSNYNSTNVDIDSGAIDGTVIGASSAAAGTFAALVGTSLSVSDGNITNVADIALDSISADGTDINIAVDDNSATALTIKQGSDAYLIVDTANSSESVSIGTGISGTQITLGHSTSETTVADNLTVTGNATISGNLQIVGDSSELQADNLVVDNPTIAMGLTNGSAPSSDSGFDLGLKPHWHTGSGAKTAFLGVDVSTSASAPKLTYIPDASFSSDVVSGTAGTIVANLEGDVTGDLTGNVTGNASGTAATVTGAAQTNITSLGTLTALTVDNVSINGTTIGHTSDTDLMTLADGVLTVAGELDATTLDISGNADIDGTTNLDAVDIDGAVQIDSTVTVGANDQGYDVIFYGDAASANMTWDTSVDDLILNGGARIVVPDGQLVLGSTAVSSTAAELNLVDGITAGTVAASKAVIVDSNKDASGFRNITASGELDAATLDISGNADIDGTLEADVITVNGETLQVVVEDHVGAMLDGTETGIAVSYDSTNNNLDFVIDAAQTTITSLLATDIKIGEDDQTKIDFEIADEIHFYAANVEQVYVADNIFGPQSDSDVDLGTTGVRWKDAFVDSITVTGEVDGASLDISGNADIDGVLETDNLTVGGDQGSDGQVLTSTGSGVAWESVSAATALDGLSDAVSGITNFTNSLILGHQTTGTLSSAEQNTAVGYAAMDAITQGDDNTIMGYNAGGAITTGSDNTLIGSGAGDALTTMTDNVAVGLNALGGSSLVDSTVVIGSGAGVAAMTAAADGAIAIGKGAGAALTTGARITAIGFEAADALTVGDDNLALGYQSMSLLSTTDGSDKNIAIGNYAMDGVSTLAATDNVFIGYGSGGGGWTGTTSIQNVAIGNNTLDAAMNACDNNVAVGHNAGSAATAATDNVFVGYNSGTAITTGDENVFVGKNAGAVSTDVDRAVIIGVNSGLAALTSDADGTVLIGYNAGKVLTDGQYNVCVGFEAGTGITSGDQNIAIGYQALTAAAATGMVGIGYRALQDKTTGDDVVAIGREAGKDLTTGHSNIAIGGVAMATHTTGDRNIAIGANCMADTDGDANSIDSNDCIFIGSGAGTSQWTGTCDKNIGIGTDALGGASSPFSGAINNVVVGYGAGGEVTSGDENTCFGHQAGNTITTGSSNVIIGADADTSGSGTNNAICLGQNITSGADEFCFGKSSNKATSTGFAGSGSCTFTYSSDERKKRNIQDNDLGLDLINKLQTRTFQWKPSEEHPEAWKAWDDVKDEDGKLTGKVYHDIDTERVHHGFIAQEVKAVLDEYGVSDYLDVWAEDAQTGEQRVGESKFMTVLIKAVQELSAKVEALEAK